MERGAHTCGKSGIPIDQYLVGRTHPGFQPTEQSYVVKSWYGSPNNFEWWESQASSSLEDHNFQ